MKIYLDYGFAYQNAISVTKPGKSGADEIKQIAGILIRKFEKTLKERNITLQISDAAMDYIVKQGYDIEYGARPLRRVIEQKLEDNIAEGIIDRSITDNSTVSVDFDGEGITINGKRGL